MSAPAGRFFLSFAPASLNPLAPDDKASLAVLRRTLLLERLQASGCLQKLLSASVAACLSGHIFGPCPAYLQPYQPLGYTIKPFAIQTISYLLTNTQLPAKFWLYINLYRFDHQFISSELPAGSLASENSNTLSIVWNGCATTTN